MNHEEALIEAFVIPVRRGQYSELLGKPKKRAKLIAQLAHFKHFDPRFVVNVPRNQQNPASLEKLLKSKGAGSKCWVISENSEIDDQEMELQTALEAIVGYQMGTLISCIPGELAYFEGEEDRFILQR